MLCFAVFQSLDVSLSLSLASNGYGCVQHPITGGIRDTLGTSLAVATAPGGCSAATKKKRGVKKFFLGSFQSLCQKEEEEKKEKRTKEKRQRKKKGQNERGKRGGKLDNLPR